MLNWDQVKNIISLLEKEKSDEYGINYNFNEDAVTDWIEHKTDKYSIEVAHQEGGEGQGDDWEIVYKFTDHELNDFAYVIYPGSYTSWCDGEITIFMEDARIVTPIEKQITVTVWEPVEDA